MSSLRQSLLAKLTDLSYPLFSLYFTHPTTNSVFYCFHLYCILNTSRLASIQHGGSKCISHYPVGLLQVAWGHLVTACCAENVSHGVLYFTALWTKFLSNIENNSNRKHRSNVTTNSYSKDQLSTFKQRGCIRCISKTVTLDFLDFHNF